MSYQPAMVPPKKNTTRTVLIVVGIVLAICCAGGAIGGFFLYRVVEDATGPAKSTVDTFAGALVSQDYPTAYGQLCGKLRDRFSQDDFARQQSNGSLPDGYEIVGLNVHNNNGRVSGSASVRYTLRQGMPTTQTYTLTKENGAWRICQ
ncbi:hypothetical protein [Micromonospora eburnea]|uniref:DUF4878 domain-containing protein n=1 Tax=Micromonospora eburnea TaxID=227316 RepID=A0A1C6VDD8_9ACTN|nr:hypothetical protein [Micromonospora eburnea]SCL64275.1 hypothetical protein GA0070604_5171 [Micromonospora eburnea]